MCACGVRRRRWHVGVRRVGVVGVRRVGVVGVRGLVVVVEVYLAHIQMDVGVNDDVVHMP